MKQAFWDSNVSEWVACRLGYDRGFGPCRAMGVARNGEVIGGVVYHNWSPENETIEISAAALDSGWTNRAIVREIFNFPFSFCQMVIAQTDAENPVRAVFAKLGAQEIHIPRLMGRHRDGVVCALTDDAWRESKFSGAANGQT